MVSSLVLGISFVLNVNFAMFLKVYASLNFLSAGMLSAPTNILKIPVWSNALSGMSAHKFTSFPSSAEAAKRFEHRACSVTLALFCSPRNFAKVYQRAFTVSSWA